MAALMPVDWPVLFVGFPLLIIGAPLGALIGRHLGRNLDSSED